jgi:hypothetical protein
MVSVLASSVVDQVFKPLSGKPKDYTIIILAKHRALRSNSKNWLTQNHDNVSKWSDVSTATVVSLSYPYKNPTQHVGLVQGRNHHISSNVICSRHIIADMTNG